MKKQAKYLLIVIAVVSFASSVFGQNNFDKPAKDKKIEKARNVVAKAVKKLGGERYLGVTSSVGKGRFSLLKDGVTVSYQSFIDVIVFPNKERTDFNEGGYKTVQVNNGATGWIYQEHLDSFRDQGSKGIESFKRSLRSHYDFLLRGKWKSEASLSYEGRRRASLGKRNDVLKLTFNDGFEVEYEFSDTGMPMKTVYMQFNAEKKEIKEETRYAQFLNEQGILTPFIIDRYSDGKHTFRVNYRSVEYNKKIPERIFLKPSNKKKLRKKLKL